MNPLDRRVCKAARSLLDWTAAALSTAAGVPTDTVRSFESGRTKSLSRPNEAAIVEAFRKAGVVFVPENGGGVGVRFKEPQGNEVAEGSGVVFRPTTPE